MKRITALLLFVSLFIDIGITNATAISQVGIACQTVNDWPVDVATVWPAAVKWHNKNPSKYAAEYMKGYIESWKLHSKVNDPNAIEIFRKYKNYWYLLEADLMYGANKLDNNAISVQYLALLMKKCSKYGRLKS